MSENGSIELDGHNGLNMDSQEIIELVMALEEALKIEIPDGELTRDDTISSLLIKVNNIIHGFTDGRMDRIVVPAPLEEVKKVIWDLSLWPKLLSQVDSINIISENEVMQNFYMTVKNMSEGGNMQVQSNRFRFGNTFYFQQPIPPKYLEKHGGYWTFKSTDSGETEIDLKHQWVPSNNATNYLTLNNDQAVNGKINDLLKKHATATLKSWRKVFIK